MEDNDRLMTVSVNLTIKVNRDAYEREYGPTTAAKLREDVKQSVTGIVQQVTYPEYTEVIADVILNN